MVGCPNSDPQGDLGKKKIKKESPKIPDKKSDDPKLISNRLRKRNNQESNLNSQKEKTRCNFRIFQYKI